MAMSRFKTFVIMLGAGAVMLPAFAHAQSVRDIDNRMRRLENEIDTLSRAIYRGEAPPAPSGGISGGSAATNAQAEVRLQQMESELRDLRGKLEEQNFEIRQLKKQVELMSSDMNLRLQDLEGSAPTSGSRGSASFTSSANTGGRDIPSTASSAMRNGASAQGNTLGTMTQNASASGMSGTISVGKNPASQYEHAFSLLKSSNYEAAEQEFSQFLATHPDHVLAGNAQYWLGETYYVRGNYEEAARVFAAGYQKYPNGSKAADNLLKLGMSLASTGNESDACVALRQLQKQYTTGAGPVLRRAQQEMNKIGCS